MKKQIVGHWESGDVPEELKDRECDLLVIFDDFPLVANWSSHCSCWAVLDRTTDGEPKYWCLIQMPEATA